MQTIPRTIDSSVGYAEVAVFLASASLICIMGWLCIGDVLVLLLGGAWFHHLEGLLCLGG